VSTRARTGGVSAMPDPGVETPYPWMYMQSHPVFVGQIVTNPMLAARVSLDIRAMRKVKATESLVVIVRYANILGSPELAFSFGRLRMLMAE